MPCRQSFDALDDLRMRDRNQAASRISAWEAEK